MGSCLVTDRIRRMGEGNVFTRVCPSMIMSVHTPTRTSSTAVGMLLAFTQEDFLVYICNVWEVHTILSMDGVVSVHDNSLHSEIF